MTPGSPPGPAAERAWLPALALAAVTLATYANSLENGFVWDDNPIIVQNPATRSLAALPEVVLSPDVVRPYYRPFSRATYLLDFQIFGMNAWGFHAVNVVLHLANVLLLWRLGLSLFRQPEPAFVAALLLAVHPVNAESVNFVSARNNLLVLLFSLVATHLLFSGGRLGTWLSAAAWLLALLSKESALAMALPWAAGVLGVRSEAPARRRLGRLLPHALSLLAYFLLRWAAVGTPALTPEGHRWDTSGLANAAWIVPRYVELVLCPVRLSVHHVPDVGASFTLLGWAVAGAATALVLLRPTLASAAGLGWLAANFLPVANLVPIPSAPLAERYAYVPAAGLWILAADAASRLLARGPRVRAGTLVAMGLVIMLLSARTVARNEDWQDDVRLFEKAVRVAPDSTQARTNLGSAYVVRGLIPQALAQYAELLRLEPGNRLARYNLARYHLMQGRPAAVRELLGAREDWLQDPAALALWDRASQAAPPVPLAPASPETFGPPS